MPDLISHPDHYNEYSTNFNGQETIETWEQLGIGFDACLANAIKYLDRCGKKPGTKGTEDMEKAYWYVERAMSNKPGIPGSEASALRSVLSHLGDFNIKRSREAMQGYINLRLRK